MKLKYLYTNWLRSASGNAGGLAAGVCSPGQERVDAGKEPGEAGRARMLAWNFQLP